MASGRAIIIGGGHNGLVCAYYLARAGMDVTVLERRDIVGGAAVTEEFHPGFWNSTASYTVSLLHPRVIADMHLHQHGLRILSRRINNFLPFPDGESLVCHPDTSAMINEVARFNRQDAHRLPDYFADLDEVVPVVREIMTTAPPQVESGGIPDLLTTLKLARRFRQLSGAARRRLIRLFTVSAAEYLQDYFESDAVNAWLGFDSIVGHYASPYSPGSAYVLLHHVVGGVNGNPGTWGHAVGGMGAITTAMARACEALDVDIRTGTPVQSVEVSKGKATGVTTDTGENLDADLVASGVHPGLLFNRLIAPEHLSQDTIDHFGRHYHSASGTFRMNVALSDLPGFTATRTPDCLEGGIIMAPGLDYMDQAYQDARHHGFSRRPIVEMLIPSLVDDCLAPPGQHVASLFCQQFDPHLGKQWQARRFDAAATIIDTVNEYAPGFRELVIGTQIHSPWDLENKFGLVGGDIFHGRLSLDQMFSARPMLGSGRYRTEIKNLYLCGSGTHPGGGVSGIPGMNAAREILG